jgi:colanic acid/amylovoran biosynthesis protein
MGVSALVSGTVTSVRSSYPTARISLLDYGKEAESYTVHSRNGPVRVDLINIRFSKKFYLRNNVARLLVVACIARLLPQGRLRSSILSRNPYLKSVLDADIVASIAGGDSFSDIYGLSRLLYVALPQILVLQLGKPLILLPQTLGPFKGVVAKAIARYIMRRASVMYSRDKTSFEEADRLLGPHRSKLRFSHDMGFVLEPVRPAEKKLRSLPRQDGVVPVVGFNVSGLLLMGGYTRNNMFGLRADYARLIREAINFFVKEQNAHVVLIPHVFTGDAESDTKACLRIFQELQPEFGERLHVINEDFNQHEIKYVIGQCDFFLGSRMHACIAALSQSIPAVCLAYSRKFIGVMESIGCAELVSDLGAQDTEATLADIRRIFASRSRIRDSLNKTIPEVKHGVLGLFTPERLGGLGQFPNL